MELSKMTPAGGLAVGEVGRTVKVAEMSPAGGRPGVTFGEELGASFMPKHPAKFAKMTPKGASKMATSSNITSKTPSSSIEKSKKIKSTLLRFLVYFCATITLGVLAFMLGYILIKGVPYLNKSLFSWTYTSDNCSVVPALINTLLLTILALAIACPLGIGSAIYLVEYSKKGNKFVKLVRLTTETLTGIPSIIYGLFGMLLFVGFLKWGYSLLAGSCTVAIMVLPTIMRTTEEALLAVPDSFREGSFGLGAGKLRTVFKIVLPSAVPGILSGIILATGRVVGETAALIYTAGTVASIPKNVMGSGRTLAIHMYVLSSEGLHTNQAFATAVVLLVMVIGVNALSSLVAKKIEYGRK